MAGVGMIHTLWVSSTWLDVNQLHVDDSQDKPQSGMWFVKSIPLRNKHSLIYSSCSFVSYKTERSVYILQQSIKLRGEPAVYNVEKAEPVELLQRPQRHVEL